MARKDPHELQGQVIGKVACMGCGKDVRVKVNRNGIAYAYCQWPDTETAEICNHQTRYSRAKSNALIAAFQKPKKEATDGSKEEPTRTKRTADRGGDEASFLGV